MIMNKYSKKHLFSCLNSEKRYNLLCGEGKLKTKTHWERTDPCLCCGREPANGYRLGGLQYASLSRYRKRSITTDLLPPLPPPIHFSPADES